MAITVPQQYHWHKMVESAFNELQRCNTGYCRLTGKTFGELMAHFVKGLDKCCLLASAGDRYIIEVKDQKKHEKILQDSRESISMICTGSAAGNQDATIILCAGEKKQKGFMDEYLVRYGVAVGFTVTMTPTAFLTEKAWEEVMPAIVKGYDEADPICNTEVETHTGRSYSII